jgi:aryl-alcohol dehydrogenase-like predicted oxidoreductase
MIYRRLEKAGIDVSALAMGGHEYLPDGRSRGFNEDFERAVTAGHIFDGFGRERRKKVLQLAFEAGINFFDVTQDSEKEALGRNLKELEAPYEIYIQTRPEGMVYTYDPYNRRMADYGALKAEVQRGLKLLQRECLDFLNIAPMRAALDHDPEYLAKIAHNLAELKKEGWIRFACCDTFSGEETYLRLMETDAFDVVYINFNFADHGALQKVLERARAKGLGVVTREAFMKGALFKMADEVGWKDRSRLALAALRWNLSQIGVTTVVVGTNNPDHLTANLKLLEAPELSRADRETIEGIKASRLFRAYEDQKLAEFFETQ